MRGGVSKPLFFMGKNGCKFAIFHFFAGLFRDWVGSGGYMVLGNWLSLADFWGLGVKKGARVFPLFKGKMPSKDFPTSCLPQWQRANKGILWE